MLVTEEMSRLTGWAVVVLMARLQVIETLLYCLINVFLHVSVVHVATLFNLLYVKPSED